MPAAGPRGDLWTLFDLASVPETGTVGELVAPFLKEAASLFHATGASIYVRVGTGGVFRLAAKFGVDSGATVSEFILVGEGIAGAVIEARQPLLVGDPTSHPLLKSKVQARRDQIGSAMVLPLMVTSDLCVGVLNLSRRDEDESFSRDDLVAAWSVARYLGLAVRNLGLLAERNEALAGARTARDEVDAVLSSLAVGVVCFKEDGSYDSSNPEAVAMLGRLEPDPRSSLDNKVLELAHRVPKEGRLRGVVRESEPFRVISLCGAPLSGGGVVVSMEDVTESEKAAQELTRIRRLAEIGEMTAAIAHEIRNPLAGICGASQILMAQGGEVLEFAEIIHEEGKRLDQLCTEFLDFAKQPDLKLAETDLRPLVESVVRLQKPNASKFDVWLDVVLPEEPVMATVDAARFSQVIHNLVLNGVQACDRNGEVRVELAMNALHVSDNGKGMDGPTVGKLFTPFFTTRPKGTGLGLSTARKIMAAHGGSIDVDSKVGQGTTFTVRWKAEGKD